MEKLENQLKKLGDGRRSNLLPFACNKEKGSLDRRKEGDSNQGLSNLLVVKEDTFIVNRKVFRKYSYSVVSQVI